MTSTTASLTPDFIGIVSYGTFCERELRRMLGNLVVAECKVDACLGSASAKVKTGE